MIILIFLILLILCIIIYNIDLISDFNDNNHTFYNNQQIVISRYNEDLEWTMQEPFNRHPMIVYNKGTNSDYATSDNILKEVRLPNVGREVHTFLYHIIDNYDNLSDVTIFLVGSIDYFKKYTRAKTLVRKVERTNRTTLSCIKNENEQHKIYDFKIDSWASTHSSNYKENSSSTLKLSPIRPYGLWYEKTYTDNPENRCITYNSIIAISKEHILQKPLSYYQRLIEHVNSSSNEETIHYFERSWYALFSPYGHRDADYS